MSPEEVEARRRQRTFWLLVGAAISLILPLAGILYIELNETSLSAGFLAGTDVFSHRVQGSEIRLMPAPTAAGSVSRPVAGQPQSSLSFIRGGEDLKVEAAQKQKTAADQLRAQAGASQAQAPPPPKPAAPGRSLGQLTPSSPTKAKAPFKTPKLKQSSWMHHWQSGSGNSNAKAQDAGQSPSQAEVPPDIQQLIKDAQGAANQQ